MSTMSRDIQDKDDDDNGDIEEEFQLKTRKSQLKDGVLEKFEQHEDSGGSFVKELTLETFKIEWEFKYSEFDSFVCF